MAQVTASRPQICLRQSHRARQIALPLNSVRMEIGEHIVRRTRTQGIRRICFGFGIVLCFEQVKDACLERLDIHTHTIGANCRGL